jgi:hypothetical protein
MEERMNALVLLLALNAPAQAPMPVVQPSPAPASAVTVIQERPGLWARLRGDHPSLLSRLRDRFSGPHSPATVPSTATPRVTTSEPPLATGPMAPATSSAPTYSGGPRP